MKCFNWKIGISFVIGVVVTLISSYYYITSEIKILRKEQELFIKEVKLEVENIYGVLHRIEAKLK